MVDVKPEVQNNPAVDHAHPNVDRNIFESAYGSQSSRDTSSGDGTRVAYTSSGARPQIDSAWPPPLEVADAQGNNLTNSTDGAKQTNSVGDKTEVKPSEQPNQSGDQTVKPSEPTPKEGDAPAVKPEEVDKPIDPSLPPELQNEAKLMKNLTGQQKTLVSTAFNELGKPLWAESEYADITGNGRYGCAASESIVKQKAGYDYADSPLVSGLVNQLQKNGWTKHSFEERQPGDTIIKHRAGQKWKKGGGISHIGTVGADINYAYNNNSDSGTWSYKPINESFSPRNKRFVLRPPASSETLVAKER